MPLSLPQKHLGARAAAAFCCCDLLKRVSFMKSECVRFRTSEGIEGGLDVRLPVRADLFLKTQASQLSAERGLAPFIFLRKGPDSHTSSP